MISNCDNSLHSEQTLTPLTQTVNVSKLVYKGCVHMYTASKRARARKSRLLRF